MYKDQDLKKIGVHNVGGLGIWVRN